MDKNRGDQIMNKALIIGGSNGIGLAVSLDLIKRGYYAVIVDRCAPDSNNFPDGSYEYHYCDLLDLDEDLFRSLADDKEIQVMMITAGFGRVADFEYLHIAEIRNLMTVNATSILQIIRIFYDRIKSSDRFYCGVMGSIAGLMSSPMFTIYSASKAALCRFVESVNIELEVSGTKNRILNVSPASFKGSSFNGGQNNIELMQELAGEIVNRIFASECLYIPQYEETFKGVLERYHNDPHEYGLHSYEYKKSSGRVFNERKAVIGYIADTFENIDVKTLDRLKQAKKQCDYLIVGVIADKSSISLDDRKHVLSGIKYVDRVITAEPDYRKAQEQFGINRIFTEI